MQLRNFDVDAFLRDTWQKKPLLIRSAFEGWANPLEPDELAGLACEPGVESRLVMRSPDSWKVEHGPFSETRFSEIGSEPWALLVQAVDHHAPEVAALLTPFRFIPNWRVDDIMVSYAVDGGGVGAHFDNYDVFLVQGLGKRRWQIGARCDHAVELLPHDDLRLLADFEPTDEWILGPGDILYVPPGVAHNGIAVGDDCMTYSVGFRAPSRSELIAHWADHLISELDDDDRYADPELKPQDNPGEISADAVARLQGMIAERMLDRDEFARWLGRYTTAPKNEEKDWRPEQPVGMEDLRSRIASGSPLLRNPASRFSFIRDEKGRVILFVDGCSHDCSGPAGNFAQQLCAHDHMVIARNLLDSEEGLALVSDLLGQGSVAFQPGD
ncbi:MAG TPA: cupin domain-containing protein [Croceibacterium sp.]|nr:cupin domain-containing protein [Croceibacterium sp.]